jgi:hypothetical protein
MRWAAWLACAMYDVVSLVVGITRDFREWTMSLACRECVEVFMVQVELSDI